MAKPKSPLLSFGARGTIADTVTFQKRGRQTIARSKPTPTDPKTALQLAQRQVYRDAVAAWNAKTPEEKDAYRGVCPGLTPYYCYMKTALASLPPVPPPVEQTEEQSDFSTPLFNLRAGSYIRGGQYLTIPNREVTKLGFYIIKTGSATGAVTFTIRKVSDDSLINSIVWGDAADLPAVYALQEATFATPVIVNELVRICVEFSSGSSGNEVQVAGAAADVKADEHLEWYVATWSIPAAWDLGYRYKYYDV